MTGVLSFPGLPRSERQNFVRQATAGWTALEKRCGAASQLLKGGRDQRTVLVTLLTSRYNVQAC